MALRYTSRPVIKIFEIVILSTYSKFFRILSAASLLVNVFARKASCGMIKNGNATKLD